MRKQRKKIRKKSKLYEQKVKIKRKKSQIFDNSHTFMGKKIKKKSEIYLEEKKKHFSQE